MLPPSLNLLQQPLQQSVERLKNTTLLQLFSEDVNRVECFSASSKLLHLDFSKNLIDQQSFSTLLSIPNLCQLQDHIQQLTTGEVVNYTEQRAALHTLLRANDEQLNKTAIGPSIIQGRKKAWSLANKIRERSLKGSTGKPIDTLVNIGIGGSYLGPFLVLSALKPYQQTDINYHFVANIDGNHIQQVLADLNPETTLFIVTSKSFSTEETCINAATAKQWLEERLPHISDPLSHFIAITANENQAKKNGYLDSHILPIWDGVGGRFSLWSNVGFITMVALGEEHFSDLLKGARQLDEHFQSAPWGENLPVILALLGIWYRFGWQCQSQAILPYHHLLKQLPEYLQQLVMESNGKSVQIDGSPIDTLTSPVIWGTEGSNGQHSFHQMLHQGSGFIPVDFLLACRGGKNELPEHQLRLIANCLAQAQGLMEGKKIAGASTLAKHKSMPGNRPSSLILFEELTPATLGEILALYEHRTFTEGVILNINSFDQWGVELGKNLSKNILANLKQKESDPTDPSTQATLNLIRQSRRR